MNRFAWITIEFAVVFALAIPAYGQTVPRTESKVVDSGTLIASGGAGNNKRIQMRVWVEQMQHSDGTFTFSLNYHLLAEDHSLLGGWRAASQLFNITYTFKYLLSLASGVVTRSGNIALTNRADVTSILFDGTDTGKVLVESITATGQRFGGASGITVSFSH